MLIVTLTPRKSFEGKPLKKISIRYSRDAYSFHCRMQFLICGENMVALVVRWVGECCGGHS